NPGKERAHPVALIAEQVCEGREGGLQLVAFTLGALLGLGAFGLPCWVDVDVVDEELVDVLGYDLGNGVGDRDHDHLLAAGPEKIHQVYEIRIAGDEEKRLEIRGGVEEVDAVDG